MNQIKTLIAQGKLQQAFGLLPTTNEFILLQGRFNRLTREQQMGTISTDNANLEYHRIAHAVLQLVGDGR